jgi:hypothetical protein
MVAESPSARPWDRVRRIALRLLVAVVIVLLGAWVAGPPGDSTAALRAIPVVPGALALFVAAVMAVALALEGGVRIVAWAKRGDRSISGAGVACFVLGLVAGLCALTLWLALFGLVAAIPGLILGGFVLRNEKRRREGHSLLNLTGLALNTADVLVVASQVITATIWL